MQVVFTARHTELRPEVKAYAEEKAMKLLKYYDLIQEIEVMVEQVEKGSYHVEMIVNAEHRNMFIANCKCPTVEACVDACHRKLERQISEHKARHRNRKHPEAGAEASTIRHSPV